MNSAATETGDSDMESGGTLCGFDGAAAFRFSAPQPSAIPVLIAAPHGGRKYPPHVIEAMRDPDSAALKLEDRLIDKIAVSVGQQTGAALLIADAPRAMIDLNRAESDVDWSMVEGGEDAVRRIGSSRRAISGLGLIPRRLPVSGEIWRGATMRSELDERIAGIHRPYHDQLDAMLRDIQARWGAALLIDLHSMPPLSPARFGDPAPMLVIGDRFGASSARTLSAATFAYCEAIRLQASHNRPYSGGYVLDRHANPTKNIHALQLEVCRTSYLDEAHSELNGNAAGITAMLAGLVRKLASETAALSPPGRFQQAAE